MKFNEKKDVGDIYIYIYIFESKVGDILAILKVRN